MNGNFDALNEANLLDEEFGEKKFSNVGWGKKETQFQGSEGKKAALKVQVEQKEESLQEEVGQKSKVSWREDCAYFVVTFQCKRNIQMFKVFNKEGLLQYTSEQCVGLGTCISWRPSGNWIAVPQKLPSKYTIALFEKNGLRHREVVLPFDEAAETVRDVSWSPDSDILLVHSIKADTKYSTIYLFTTTNYHWYQKQTLRFDFEIVQTVWHTSGLRKKTIHVFSNDGTHLTYCWDNCVNRSSGDEAIVAVIDGNSLLLTAFKNSVVPPPMSNCRLTFEQPLNFICIPSFEQDIHQLLVVDCSDQIHLVSCKFSGLPLAFLNKVTREQTFKFKVNESTPLSLYHFLWMSTKKICFLNYEYIFLATLESTTENNEIIVDNAISQQMWKVGNLNALNSFCIVGQEIEGKVFKLEINSEPKVSEQIVSISLEYRAL